MSLISNFIFLPSTVNTTRLAIDSHSTPGGKRYLIQILAHALRFTIKDQSWLLDTTPLILVLPPINAIPRPCSRCVNPLLVKKLATVLSIQILLELWRHRSSLKYPLFIEGFCRGALNRRMDCIVMIKVDLDVGFYSHYLANDLSQVSESCICIAEC